MRASVFLLFLITFIFHNAANGQSVSEQALVKGIYKDEINLRAKTDSKRRKFSIVNGLFNFYKKNISDQIINDCVYENSCSAFSKDVFQNYGAIKGLFLTCDRLSRCNRLSYEETPRERINEKGKIVDRWEDYKFEK